MLLLGFLFAVDFSLIGRLWHERWLFKTPLKQLKLWGKWGEM